MTPNKKAEETPSTETKPKQGFTFTDRWKLKHHPETSYVITMFRSNGTSRTFVIVAKGETFTMRGGRTYYLRFEDSLFDRSHNQQHLYFHEDHPVPISRAIIKQGDKAFFAVVPDNLKPLLKMEYIKALASSVEINKYLRLLVVFAIINLGAAALTGFFVYRLVNG
jgi:hypothetical protein